MACTVALSLREPVLEMEKPYHPFYEPWRASLILLRRIALDRKWRFEDYMSNREQGYLGVDKDHPDRAIYIYHDFAEKNFKVLKRSCASKKSTLSQTLSPLLNEPLTATCITRLPSKIRIGHSLSSRLDPPAFKCMEFLRVHWAEPQSAAGRRSIGPSVFHQNMNFDGECHTTEPPFPITSYTIDLLDSGKTTIYCIRWKSFQDRTSVFSDTRSIYLLKVRCDQEERGRILKDWGKTDDNISWEEELLLFFLSNGATSIHSQLVTARLMSGAYFGWSNEREQQRPKPCVIM